MVSKLFNRYDLILLASILLIGITGLFIGKLKKPDEGKTVYITIDGEEYCTSRLDTDNTYIIDNEYGHNTVRIENSTVYVESADCPDKICVNHKKISKENETIVCLPHKLIVRIVGDDNGESMRIGSEK